MKLTKYIREAFVRTAMQDVPQIDYLEKIRSAANKEIEGAKKAAGIHEVSSERLSRNWSYVRDSKGNVVVTIYAAGLLDAELNVMFGSPEIIAMADGHINQKLELDSLRNKLEGAIAACTTRKQAVEALPEFEKYLPADEPKALRSLPAIANVAADFVKAGWPKDKA